MVSHRYNHHNHQSFFKNCCCLLLLLLSLLLLLTLAIFLIVLLAVKPKKPEFDLQQATISHVSITSMGPTTPTTVSLYIHLIFTAVNPNKVGIQYSHSHFTLFYHGVPLAHGSLPGFNQPSHSYKTVETIVAVDRVDLLPRVGLDLINDASVYDLVKIRILGDVSANIKIACIDTPRVTVSVDCLIGVSPSKQAVVSKQCGVDGLSV